VPALLIFAAVSIGNIALAFQDRFCDCLCTVRHQESLPLCLTNIAARKALLRASYASLLHIILLKNRYVALSAHGLFFGLDTSNT
jgi:hypothetical protein